MNGAAASAQTNLRLRVVLMRSAEEIIRTETEEVNMEGFFCYARTGFSLGEQLEFVLKLPSAGCQAQSSDFVYLSGLAQVMLITACGAEKTIGIGCQVRHYRVLSHEDLASHGHAVRTFLELGS